jgi:hypothetical protein
MDHVSKVGIEFGRLDLRRSRVLHQKPITIGEMRGFPKMAERRVFGLFNQVPFGPAAYTVRTRRFTGPRAKLLYMYLFHNSLFPILFIIYFL